MRILFVENHIVFAETVIGRFLGQHAVVLVSSVAEAHRAAGSRQFDVILVDYDLDDAKGDGFVRELRGNGCVTPIVAVSARDDGNEALLRAGANAACSKSQFSSIGSVLARIGRSFDAGGRDS